MWCVQNAEYSKYICRSYGFQARLSVPQDIAKSVNLFLRTAWETRPERSKTWALLKATRAVLALK